MGTFEKFLKIHIGGHLSSITTWLFLLGDILYCAHYYFGVVNDRTYNEPLLLGGCIFGTLLILVGSLINKYYIRRIGLLAMMATFFLDGVYILAMHNEWWHTSLIRFAIFLCFFGNYLWLYIKEDDNSELAIHLPKFGKKKEGKSDESNS